MGQLLMGSEVSFASHWLEPGLKRVLEGAGRIKGFHFGWVVCWRRERGLTDWEL